MGCAVDERFELHPTAHVKRTDSFGRIHLVTSQRKQVHPELTHVGWDFAGGLGGIGVEQDAAFAGDGRNLGDRLNRANLVVGVHDADEERSAPRLRRRLFAIRLRSRRNQPP